jgi:hypothetical protein
MDAAMTTTESARGRFRVVNFRTGDSCVLLSCETWRDAVRLVRDHAHTGGLEVHPNDGWKSYKQLFGDVTVSYTHKGLVLTLTKESRK